MRYIVSKIVRFSKEEMEAYWTSCFPTSYSRKRPRDGTELVTMINRSAFYLNRSGVIEQREVKKGCVTIDDEPNVGWSKFISFATESMKR